MNNEIKSIDEETKQRIFQQVMDIFIIPEIKRRRNIEETKPFVLSSAQIVFSLKDGKNTTRLNEEVKAVANIKLNTSKIKGEPVYDNEVDYVEGIQLTDEDVNCAHITLLLIKNSWIISFDFRYNKELAKEHLEASKDFYESAKSNLENNRIRPFFEDAFASAELSAKSILLLLPDKEILEGKNHEDRIKKFSNWAELGNVNIDFSTTLSKLKSLRSSARYLSSDDYKNENPLEIINILNEMINFSEKSIGIK